AAACGIDASLLETEDHDGSATGDGTPTQRRRKTSKSLLFKPTGRLERGALLFHLFYSMRRLEGAVRRWRSRVTEIQTFRQ
ncbi:unnamed protein product, partial [Amoebophrya sp. A25]